MKLKDLKPGDCFTSVGGFTRYVLMEVHRCTKVSINGGGVRSYPALNLTNFQITTWAPDGDYEVELVEDL